MKKLKLLLVLICIFAMTSCVQRTNINIQNYEGKREKVPHASALMPTLNELGKYSNISYSYKYKLMLIFESYTLTLFVEYPQEIYEEKKSEVLSSYKFLQETKISSDGKEYLSPPAKFNHKGYDFQTAYNPDNPYSDDEREFCKSFALIGFDDDTCKIAYCYFYDFDLDLIGSTKETETAMIAEFIDEYFRWNDIKK